MFLYLKQYKYKYKRLLNSEQIDFVGFEISMLNMLEVTFAVENDKFYNLAKTGNMSSYSSKTLLVTLNASRCYEQLG